MEATVFPISCVCQLVWGVKQLAKAANRVAFPLSFVKATILIKNFAFAVLHTIDDLSKVLGSTLQVLEFFYLLWFLILAKRQVNDVRLEWRVWDKFVVGLFFDFKDDWVEIGVFAVGDALSNLSLGIDNGWRGLLEDVVGLLRRKRSRTGFWIKVEQGMIGKAFMWGDSAGRGVVAF